MGILIKQWGQDPSAYYVKRDKFYTHKKEIYSLKHLRDGKNTGESCITLRDLTF